MPLKRDHCECGSGVSRCPDCGSRHVTPREHPRRPTPNELVDYGDPQLPDDTVRVETEYTHVCWECEWSEDVTVIVERQT